MCLIYNIDFDIAALLISSILFVIVKNFYVKSSKSNRLFRIFMMICVASGIFDIITAFTISNADSIPPVINQILNTIYLLLAYIAAYRIEKYIFTTINLRKKVHMWFDIVVSWIYITALTASFFTGIIFDFKGGKYNHGPLFLMNFICPLFFLFHIAVVLISERKAFTKKQLILNYSVVVFPLVAAVFQIIFPSCLLTFFSYTMFSFVMLFSLETPDFVELEYLEKEVKIQAANATKRQRKIELMSLEATQALAEAIDEKDDYTNGHSMRVSVLSVLLAQSLDWDLEKTEHLRLAALLHDIGKIGIPDSILKKPNKLTSEEYEIIKTHTEKGGRILHNLTSLSGAKDVALYHHERYDGKGYPGKYSGKEIPDFARIVTIADSFDAMTSNRVYRSKLQKEQVMSEMLKNSGTQFDPDFLKNFIELIDCGIVSL